MNPTDMTTTSKNCKKSFSNSKRRKKSKHIIDNQQAKPDRKCQACGKTFSQAGNLKIHVHTVHENRKDYKCESCGKSFTTY